MTDIAACVGREIERLWVLYGRERGSHRRDEICCAIREAEDVLAKSTAMSLEGALAQLVLVAGHAHYMEHAGEAHSEELKQVLALLYSAIAAIETVSGARAEEFGAQSCMDRRMEKQKEKVRVAAD